MLALSAENEGPLERERVVCGTLYYVLYVGGRTESESVGRMRGNFLTVKYDQFDNRNNQFLSLGYTSSTPSSQKIPAKD